MSTFSIQFLGGYRWRGLSALFCAEQLGHKHCLGALFHGCLLNSLRFLPEQPCFTEVHIEAQMDEVICSRQNSW